MHKSLWVKSLIVGAVAATVSAVSLATYGYVYGFDNPELAPATAAEPSATTAAASTSTTLRPTTTTLPPTTTTHPAMADPAPQVMPEVSGNGLGQYQRNDAIRIYEQRLKDLRFDPGDIDGKFDQNTRYAVEAVQKLAGLPRTGRIDAATRATIGAFKYPKPLVANGEADRVEIDLDRQVLIVWTQWQITLMTTTSTGNGRHFCGGDDGCQYAVTPPGRFTFTWHANGWKKGKLGRLWNPYYFNGGIAVHGYSSVPTEPASHGCARIPMDIATYFATLVHKGEPVYVVGTEAPRGGKGGSGSGNRPTTTTIAPTTTAPPVTTAPPKTTVPPTTHTTVAPTTTTPPTTAAPTTTT